ncbi:hypothetical protein SISNIDRAFT_464045 [Sistotremastrum niveocremeum HHB9708]|uniref:DNA 3'-5' helicase n=1 Tax=Sistotremastrum niveocremeum HHB9708 TaxID=1314777 RepID=A0A164Y4X6_9AGAM|nr:hypothetical protein SISNIDRAFT_464045 [Sistotremastrum niveocremeum HHB9708]
MSEPSTSTTSEPLTSTTSEPLTSTTSDPQTLPFQCNVFLCASTFSTAKALADHDKKTHGKAATCQKCDARFRDAKTRDIHRTTRCQPYTTLNLNGQSIVVHRQPDGSFRCPAQGCTYASNEAKNVRTHIRTHSNPPPARQTHRQLDTLRESHEPDGDETASLAMDPPPSPTPSVFTSAEDHHEARPMDVNADVHMREVSPSLLPSADSYANDPATVIPPVLSKCGMIVNLDFHVPICRICAVAIPIKDILNHPAQHDLPKPPRDPVAAMVEEYKLVGPSGLVMPTAPCPPVVGLAPPVEGYMCPYEGCLWSSNYPNNVVAHHDSKHKSIVSSATLPRTLFQYFYAFNAHRCPFPVTSPLYTDSTGSHLPMLDDLWTNHRTAANAAILRPATTPELSAWCNLTRWHNLTAHFKASDEFEDLVQLASVPSKALNTAEPDLGRLETAFVSYFDHISKDLIMNVSGLTRQKIRTHNSNSVFTIYPFVDLQNKSTMKDYARYSCRLLHMIVRGTRSPHPTFPLQLTLPQKIATETLISCLALPESPETALQLRQAIHELLLTLFAAYGPDHKGDFDCVVVRFLAVSHMHRSGQFFEPVGMSHDFAALQWCVRACATKSIAEDPHGEDAAWDRFKDLLRQGCRTPYDRIRHYLTHARLQALNRMSVGVITWGLGYKYLTANNITVVVLNLQLGIPAFVKELEQNLQYLLMSGFELPEEWHNYLNRFLSMEENNSWVKDKVDCVDNRYSFITDPANEFHKWREWLLRRMLGPSHWQGGKNTPFVFQGKLDPMTVSKFFDDAARFALDLSALIQLSYGGPGRATELAPTTFACIPNTIRKLYFYHGSTVIVSTYNKTRTQTGNDNYILRALPDCVSRLLITYLSIVRPVEQLLSQEHFGQYRECYDTHLFVAHGTPLTAEDICSHFLSVTQFFIQTPLPIREFRHVVCAIGRQWLSDKDPECDKSHIDTLQNQMGHTAAIAKSIYAVLTNAIKLPQAHDFDREFRLSLSWHNYIGLGRKQKKQPEIIDLCGTDDDVPPARLSKTEAFDPVLQQQQLLSGVHRAIAPALHSLSLQVESLRTNSRLDAQPIAEPIVYETRYVGTLRAALKDNTATFRSPEQYAFVKALESSSKDILAVLPTGGGKTLGVQVPASLYPERTVVALIPFLALAEDMHAKLTAMGLETVIYRYRSNNIAWGRVRVVIVSIEQFANYEIRVDLGNHANFISRVVLDEAHQALTARVFRPSFEALTFLGALGPPVVLLTGTLPVSSEQALLKAASLNPSNVTRIRTPCTGRPELCYRIRQVDSEIEAELAAENHIKAHIFEHARDRGMIFVPSKTQAIALAKRMNLPCIHGDLKASARASILTAWRDGTGPRWIIGTDALASGIDYPWVRIVIYIEMPQTMMDFVQGSGRAGRDRKPALVQLYWSRDNLPLRNPTEAKLEAARHACRDQVDTFLGCDVPCQRMILSSCFDAYPSSCTSIPQAQLCDVCELKCIDERGMLPPAQLPLRPLTGRVPDPSGPLGQAHPPSGPNQGAGHPPSSDDTIVEPMEIDSHRATNGRQSSATGTGSSAATVTPAPQSLKRKTMSDGNTRNSVATSSSGSRPAPYQPLERDAAFNYRVVSFPADRQISVPFALITEHEVLLAQFTKMSIAHRRIVKSLGYANGCIIEWYARLIRAPGKLSPSEHKHHFVFACQANYWTQPSAPGQAALSDIYEREFKNMHWPDDPSKAEYCFTCAVPTYLGMFPHDYTRHDDLFKPLWFFIFIGSDRNNLVQRVDKTKSFSDKEMRTPAPRYRTMAMTSSDNSLDLALLPPRRQKILLCAPIVNTAWRSSSLIFRPQFWLSRPNLSFAQAVTQYVDGFQPDPGHRTLFQHLGQQIDEFESTIDRDSSLTDIICEPGIDNDMYPTQDPARKCIRPYMLCVLLDRLLWSLEDDFLVLPPQWHHPHSTVQRADSRIFQALETLPAITHQFLVDMAASASDENADVIAMTSPSDSHVAASFYEKGATSHAKGNIHHITSHFMYWCGTAMVAVKGFPAGQYEEIVDIIRQVQSPSLSFSLTNTLFPRERASPDLRRKLDHDLGSMTFRGLQPFFTTIAHSPITLFSPAFFATNRTRQKSTVAEWMQHVGWAHSYPRPVLNIEHSLWQCLRNVVAAGFQSVEATTSSQHQRSIALLTLEHIPFGPLQTAIDVLHDSSTDYVAHPQEPWPFDDFAPPPSSAQPRTPSPPCPTPGFARFASSPDPQARQDTYRRLAHAQIQAPDMTRPIQAKSRKRKRRNTHVDLVRETPNIPSRASTQPPLNPTAAFPAPLMPPRVSTFSTIDLDLPVFPFTEEVILLLEYSCHITSTYMLDDDEYTNEVEEYEIQSVSNRDNQDLTDILQQANADDHDSVQLAPDHYFVSYNGNQHRQLLVDPLESICKFFTLYPPADARYTLNPQVARSASLNLYTRSLLYHRSDRPSQFRTTIGDFVSAPLSHRLGMCLKNLAVPHERAEIPLPVCELSCLSFAMSGTAQPPFDPSSFVSLSIYSQSAFDRLSSSPCGFATWIRVAYGVLLVATIPESIGSNGFILPQHVNYQHQSWSYEVLHTGDAYILPPGSVYCIYALTDAIARKGFFYSWSMMRLSMHSDIVDHVRQVPIPRNLYHAAELYRHTLAHTLADIISADNALGASEEREWLLFPRLESVACLCAWIRLHAVIQPTLTRGDTPPSLDSSRTAACEQVLRFKDLPQYRGLSLEIMHVSQLHPAEIALVSLSWCLLASVLYPHVETRSHLDCPPGLTPPHSSTRTPPSSPPGPVTRRPRHRLNDEPHEDEAEGGPIDPRSLSDLQDHYLIASSSRSEAEYKQKLDHAIQPLSHTSASSKFQPSPISLPSTDGDFVAFLEQRYGINWSRYGTVKFDRELWTQKKSLFGFTSVDSPTSTVDYTTSSAFMASLTAPCGQQSYDFQDPVSQLASKSFPSLSSVYLKRTDGETIRLYCLSFKPSPQHLVIPKAVDVLSLYRHEPAFVDLSDAANFLLRLGACFAIMQSPDDLGSTKTAAPTCSPDYMFSDHMEPMLVYRSVPSKDHRHNATLYEDYQRRCHAIMTRPHARVALSYGGFIARIAREYIDPATFLAGPSVDAMTHGRLWAVSNGSSSLIDDVLTKGERKIISGTIYPLQGRAVHSYWPPLHFWTKVQCAVDMGYWSPALESFFVEQHKAYKQGRPPPMLAWWRKWIGKLQGYRVSFRDNAERAASEFLDAKLSHV